MVILPTNPAECRHGNSERMVNRQGIWSCFVNKDDDKTDEVVGGKKGLKVTKKKDTQKALKGKERPVKSRFQTSCSMVPTPHQKPPVNPPPHPVPHMRVKSEPPKWFPHRWIPPKKSSKPAQTRSETQQQQRPSEDLGGEQKKKQTNAKKGAKHAPDPPLTKEGA